jgi:vacuolar protein sorting-associated protein 54
MDLSNDVVQLFLTWNEGTTNAEARAKVKHTILALKKCKKISTMANVYREKICETIRVTIRTTVTECAVDAAKDSKEESTPSATVVSIPTKDGNEKTSITQGVTSMNFEQFMDCLDMIFEQSLGLLRSAAAANKFCLEEGISFKEDENSRGSSALSAASDLSHKSISEILRLRKDAHSLISFEDMRRLWDSCLTFTLQVEKVSGQKAYGLRSTLLAQAKAFVERKHESNMSSLVAALEGERWSQCDVSILYILSCAFFDIKFLTVPTFDLRFPPKDKLLWKDFVQEERCYLQPAIRVSLTMAMS